MGLSLRYVTMIREEAGNDSNSASWLWLTFELRFCEFWALQMSRVFSARAFGARECLLPLAGRCAQVWLFWADDFCLASLDSDSWSSLTNEAEDGVLLALRMTIILKISRLAPPALADLSCPWSRKCASRWGSFAEWGLILTHDFDWLTRPIKAYFWSW